MTTALESAEFVRAFVRSGRTLWVLAAAWVGRSDAEDLVQETARVAWERREAFQPGTEIRAWLAQIARNLGSNWRRRRGPEVRSPDELPEVAACAQPMPVVAWPFDADGCGLGDDLARALEVLSETARACLLLHVVLGHSFTEIGRLLDIPENTAMSHARRARTRLREALAAPIMDL